MKTKFLLPVAAALIFPNCSTESKQENQQSEKRPNIVIILADDLGYSDIGCYGGEIQTPSLDALAKNGIRFSQFYSASRCCPTRASLLTGKYPHQVGLRFNGQSLSKNAPTIAEILKDNGYNTGMAGKWHLSRTQELNDQQEQLLWLSHRKDSSIFAPLETYPCNRGFQEYWGGRALRIGSWKISALDHGEWGLFFLAQDRTETNNLAEQMPEKVKEMESVWKRKYEELTVNTH